MNLRKTWPHSSAAVVASRKCNASWELMGPYGSAWPNPFKESDLRIR